MTPEEHVLAAEKYLTDMEAGLKHATSLYSNDADEAMIYNKILATGAIVTGHLDLAWQKSSFREFVTGERVLGDEYTQEYDNLQTKAAYEMERDAAYRAGDRMADNAPKAAPGAKEGAITAFVETMSDPDQSPHSSGRTGRAG